MNQDQFPFLSQTAPTKALRIGFAGGKTGGHLYPGVTLAEELKARGHYVHFLCTRQRLDRKILRQHRISHNIGCSASPYSKILVSWPTNLLGLVQAWRWMRVQRFDLVIGLGGYPCFLAILAAFLQRKPSVLLEQNVQMGRANRFLLPLVRKVFVSFALTRYTSKRYSHKCVWAGNPLRNSVREPQDSRQDLCQQWQWKSDRPIVLIIGGSQGSLNLNKSLLSVWKKWQDMQASEIQILHIAGSKGVRFLEREYKCLGLTARVQAFAWDIGSLWHMADVVICRAGATTLAELIAVGKPAILVPLMHVGNQHQLQNAELLRQMGAAEMVYEEEMDTELPRILKTLIEDESRKSALVSQLMHLRCDRDPAQTISQQIEQMFCGSFRPDLDASQAMEVSVK